MDSLLINSIASLCGIGIIAATILYFVATNFKVFENPKIDEVEEALPAANCGACGFAGCRQFAEATTKASDLSTLNCPVGGNECMAEVAQILGLKAVESEPTVAVLRCNGSKENAPQKVAYDGARSCLSANAQFAGESGCAYGCLGLGDCINVCHFDALKIDKITGLPVVDALKCTSCGACVNICPRNIFEIRPKDKDVYVACMSLEKGGPAKKNCKVACIGCTKCAKVYDSKEDIKITSFLSYISPKTNIEEFGGKIIACCPTNAIIGVNVEAEKPEPKPASEA